MSSVIDERVVQMSFDNDQFEKGVSQTINSLNKLDKTLVDTADGEYFTKMEERISMASLLVLVRQLINT